MIDATALKRSAVLLPLLVFHAAALRGAPLKPARVLGESEVLYKIQHIAVAGERVAVLTATGPTVHLFSGTKVTEWGKRGQGPGEVENPAAVLLDGQEVIVVDGSANRGRVIRFAAGGKVLSEQSVAKPSTIGLLEKCGDSFLIQGGGLGGASSAVFRLGSMKEVLRLPYNQALTITVRPKQGASLETPIPGTPSPAWACLADGRLAYWDGESRSLELLDLEGRQLATLALPKDRIPFEEPDKAAWLATTFPRDAELLGQKDFLRHARKEAEKVVPFPKHFAPLQRLVPDARAGVWALRAAKHSGQVWALLRPGAAPRTVTFPPGRNVHAFGDTYIAAKVVDDLGVETVELYRRRDVLPEEARPAAR